METLDATDVADTCATLHGTVNPNGLSTTVHFDNDNGGQHHSTPDQTFNGNTQQDVNANIIGLIPDTFSNFVLVATNGCGTNTTTIGASVRHLGMARGLEQFLILLAAPAQQRSR